MKYDKENWSGIFNFLTLALNKCQPGSSAKPGMMAPLPLETRPECQLGRFPKKINAGPMVCKKRGPSWPKANLGQWPYTLYLSWTQDLGKNEIVVNWVGFTPELDGCGDPVFLRTFYFNLQDRVQKRTKLKFLWKLTMKKKHNKTRRYSYSFLLWGPAISTLRTLNGKIHKTITNFHLKKMIHNIKRRRDEIANRCKPANW